MRKPPFSGKSTKKEALILPYYAATKNLNPHPSNDLRPEVRIIRKSE
jgi:hypothetical protein